MMYGYSEREKQVADALTNKKPTNTVYNDAKNRVADVQRGF